MDDLNLAAHIQMHHALRTPTPREALLQDLFRAQDLNQNGLLEEQELIQLNKRIAYLHYGGDADLDAVAQKYQELFRTRLDPEGKPVSYPVFRQYMREVLAKLDPDLQAQEMILEQFVAEADVARAAFDMPWQAVPLEGSAPAGTVPEPANMFGGARLPHWSAADLDVDEFICEKLKSSVSRGYEVDSASTDSGSASCDRLSSGASTPGSSRSRTLRLSAL